MDTTADPRAAVLPCLLAAVSITTPSVRGARRRLVEQHVDLVDQLARSVRKDLEAALPPDDLRSFGFEALVRAARTWDARQGVPFGAYARYRVRGAILDGLAELGGVSRRMYRH